MEWLDEKRRATKRLIEYIEKQAVLRPFSHVADEVGVSQVTIKNVFDDFTARENKLLPFKTPEIIGIDEIYLLRKNRCVITNIKEKTIIDLLPDRLKPTLTKYFSIIPDKHLIQFASMDMWTGYRNVVQEQLPQTIIVIDKFHVVRMANQAVDKVRIRTRKNLTKNQAKGLAQDKKLLLKQGKDLEVFERFKLESWTKNYPTLGRAYNAKEAFYKIIHESQSADIARAEIKRWQEALPSDVRGDFKPLTTAIKNWHNEIFTYFDNDHVTNAYTESINNLIRLINRIGRGYSFDAIRAKIMFSENLYKGRRPRFNKNDFVHDIKSGAVKLGPEKDKKWSYGVDIPLLCQKLEEGSF